MTSALPDHLPGDDDFVLAGRPLRPGFSLADTARFGEDEWRLEPAILQEHVKSLALTFQTVPSRYRLQAKQLFYAVLAGPLPPGEKRLGIATARSLFVCVKAFLKWLDARPATDGRRAHPRLGDLTGQDLEDYERHIVEHFRNPGMRENARRGVHMLWRYRSGLSDPLRINPRHVEGFGRVGARRRENATDRIPEPVLAPLIAWAMRFVDSFSADILAADAAWREYHCQLKRSDRCGRNGGVVEDLRAYFDSHIERGSPSLVTAVCRTGGSSARRSASAGGVWIDRKTASSLTTLSPKSVLPNTPGCLLLLPALWTGRRGSTVLQCDTHISPSKDWRGYCRSAATS